MSSASAAPAATMHSAGRAVRLRFADDPAV